MLEAFDYVLSIVSVDYLHKLHEALSKHHSHFVNKPLKPIHTNQHLQNLDIRQNEKGYGVTPDLFCPNRVVWFTTLNCTSYYVKDE